MKAKIIVDSCCHVPNAHVPGRTGRGKAACGVLVIDENGNEQVFSKYLGEMTAPEAEFNGLIFGLDQSTSVTRNDVEVWMDSELVVKWMRGEYRLKKKHIRPLFDKAKLFEQRYKSVEYFHHPRTATLASKADRIAEIEYSKIMQ